MNQETIQLVQGTWKAVEPISAAAAKLFYQNLFEADPTVQLLFKGNMEQQGARLMQMIGAAVGKLDDLDGLVPVLQDLARRHVGYGVKDAHYDTVGAALLKTLSQGLGAGFTPPVEKAWTEVYGLIATTMIAATKK